MAEWLLENSFKSIKCSKKPAQFDVFEKTFYAKYLDNNSKNFQNQNHFLRFLVNDHLKRLEK